MSHLQDILENGDHPAIVPRRFCRHSVDNLPRFSKENLHRSLLSGLNFDWFTYFTARTVQTGIVKKTDLVLTGAERHLFSAGKAIVMDLTRQTGDTSLLAFYRAVGFGT